MAEITTDELKALLRECRAVIDDATDTMPDAEPLLSRIDAALDAARKRG